jgi:tRNA pseudouridine55 synthase
VLDGPRVGHTGTLDPLASGVLPLVVGRATRLARFLSGADKSYEAIIRLGFATATYDSTGEPTGPRYTGILPSLQAIDSAADAFRGTFLQQPPAFSAKKIGGRRSYRLARSVERARRGAGASAPAEEKPGAAAQAQPATVSTRMIELLALQGEFLTLRVECSAGFYVRSLAHDLGERLGTGAHLSALRRTRSGDATLADAIPLAALEGPGGRDLAEAAVIPMERLLPEFPAVTLRPEGVERAAHGRDLGPPDFIRAPDLSSAIRVVRLLGPAGDLVGIGETTPTPGFLHPRVVLV